MESITICITLSKPVRGQKNKSGRRRFPTETTSCTGNMDRPFVRKLRMNKRYRSAKRYPFIVEDYVPVSTPSPQSTATNKTTDAASTVPMLSQLTKGNSTKGKKQYCGATIRVKEETQIPEYTADYETGFTPPVTRSTTRRKKHHIKQEKNHTKSTQMTKEPAIKKEDPYRRPRLPTIFPQFQKS